MSKSPHPKDEELCHELQVQVLALDLAQFEWAQEQEEEENQQEQVMFSVVSMVWPRRIPLLCQSKLLVS